MKRLSTALLAAGLFALAACGGRSTNNATTNVEPDVYNVSPDDLTANDLGGDLGNGSGSNASSGSSSGNASSSNTSSNASGSASNSTGNSH